MVGIVSGSGLGLESSSREVLGRLGVAGNPLHGRHSQAAHVNVANGLLVLQQQDDSMAARGDDYRVVRTYNSQGVLAQGDGGWTRQAPSLQVVGVLESTGSSILRTASDGSTSTFWYDAAQAAYVSTDGAGAYDSIRYIPATASAAAQFEWSDGATGALQRYEGAGQRRLLSSEDAAGNTLSYAYHASGTLRSVTAGNGDVTVYEYTGDRVTSIKVTTGGVSTSAIDYVYDAHGRLTTVKVDLTPSDASDAKVYLTRYSYDDDVAAGVISSRVKSTWQTDGTALTFTYDASGRVSSVTDGVGQTTSFQYAAGYTTVTDPMGFTTRYDADASGQLSRIVGPAVGGVSAVQQFTYNDRGDVSSVADGNGRTVTYEYDARGNQIFQRDSAGNVTRFTYDNARQRLTQTSTRGASTTWGYDAAGQVTRITDSALNKVSTFSYDLSGRKLRERVTQGGVTYQDNHLAYDALGRLRDVADARVHITMDYDKVGNRTRIGTTVNYLGATGEANHNSQRYFKYDAMNRQIVVDAVDAAHSLGQVGHRIAYDLNGNRTSDTYWGNRVVPNGPAIIGYNEDGSAVYSTGVTYSRSVGTTTETYRYDMLNRLQSVERDGVQIDLRRYDGADRVVQSGPGTNLSTDYVSLINEGVAPGEVNGKERRISRYDANGRLLHQRIIQSDGKRAKADISWDPTEPVKVFTGTDESGLPIYHTYTPDGYDAAGNARGYLLQDYDNNTITEYTTTSVRYDAYQADATTSSDRGGTIGSVKQQYDVNGFLIGVDDSEDGNDRTFVNDSTGKQLFVNQGGKVMRQLIVNGEVLGIYGAAPAGNPNIAGEVHGDFANLVDFDFGYAPVSANYPTPSPGSYQVRAGDTLQSIAQGAYGDSSLWYRIAEANGLSGNNDLRVGQTVNIPNRVSTINNNSTTFKPYDPTEIQGDMSPLAMRPQGDDGCGAVGQIVMIVVAIVVTIYTAGAAAGALGATTTTAAGTVTATAAAASTSTFAVGGAVLSGAYGAAGVAAAAIGAAAGSVASQLVGLATGTIDKFDWKNVALSALSGGMTAGVGSAAALAGGGMAGAVCRAVLSNVATQGVAVAVGLQDKFDWRGVAASAAGGAVGHAVGDALSGNAYTEMGPNGQPITVRGEPAFGYSAGGQFAQRAITGLAAGTAAAVMRGGKLVVQQIAADAFGNALGSSLASASSSDPTRDPSNMFYENEMDRQSDNYEPPVDDALRVNGLTFAQAKALQQASNNPHGLPTRASGNERLSNGTATEEDSWVVAGGPFQSDAGNGLGTGRRITSALPGTLTAQDWTQEAERFRRDATTMADAAQYARDRGRIAAADEYQQRANAAHYAALNAAKEASSIRAATQGTIPQTSQQFSVPPGWSQFGQNSIGYFEGRGIAPDYQSFTGGAHTLTGSVATNLYDGTTFYGGGPFASNVDPGFRPTGGYSIGWILGARNANAVNSFLGGSGTQFGLVIPTPWALSPTIVINHSYGGATSLELGLVPRVKTGILVYQPYGESKEVGK